jgi:nucleoside-diphosphate-sugar epimerase
MENVTGESGDLGNGIADSAVYSCFVTGGTGFLGLNLVEQLVRQGWHVTALHRPTSVLTYLKRQPVDLVVGDIEDRERIREVMPEGLTAVFHVAADVSHWSRNAGRLERSNVDGTRNVVAAALARGARKLIHTSSTSVYGYPAGPFDETAPRLGASPRNHYARSKALAEAEVQKGIDRGLDAVILNPANIMGAYDIRNWARMFQMVANGRLPGLPPGRGSFCHAVEVAKAHVSAVKRGRTGERYLLGGADASYLEVAQQIASLLGKRPNFRRIPAPVVAAGARVAVLMSLWNAREPWITPEIAALMSRDVLCKSNKAIRELGYRPASLETMLEDSYRWLKTERLI